SATRPAATDEPEKRPAPCQPDRRRPDSPARCRVAGCPTRLASSLPGPSEARHQKLHRRRLPAKSTRLTFCRLPLAQRSIVGHACIDPARTLRGLFLLPERRLGPQVVDDEFAGIKCFTAMRGAD